MLENFDFFHSCSCTSFAERSKFIRKIVSTSQLDTSEIWTEIGIATLQHEFSLCESKSVKVGNMRKRTQLITPTYTSFLTLPKRNCSGDGQRTTTTTTTITTTSSAKTSTTSSSSSSLLFLPLFLPLNLRHGPGPKSQASPPTGLCGMIDHRLTMSSCNRLILASWIYAWQVVSICSDPLFTLKPIYWIREGHVPNSPDVIIMCANLAINNWGDLIDCIIHI